MVGQQDFIARQQQLHEHANGSHLPNPNKKNSHISSYMTRKQHKEATLQNNFLSMTSPGVAMGSGGPGAVAVTSAGLAGAGSGGVSNSNRGYHHQQQQNSHHNNQ